MDSAPTPERRGSRNTRRPRRRWRRRKKQHPKPPTPAPKSPLADVFLEELADSEGEDCEVQVYEERHNSRGEHVSLRVGTQTEFDFPKSDSHRAALVLHRIFDSRQKLQNTWLTIKSSHIKKALREVIGTYPNISLKTSSNAEIPAPPACLFHYRSELEDYATKSQDSVVKDHLRLCLDYLKTDLRRELSVYQATMVASEQPSIEYQYLWMVFKPNTLIYRRVDNIEVVSRLSSFGLFGHYLPGSTNHVHLVIENIDFDGTDFGLIQESISIERYDGSKPLTELEAFPLQYHPDQERIRRDLLHRGKRFMSLCGTHHRFYDGPARFCDRDLESNYHVQHRIIIDPKEFENNTSIGLSGFDEYLAPSKIGTPAGANFSDDEFIICGHEIPGFSLVWRRWAYFKVEHVHEVEFDNDAFEQLVLSEGKKQLIKSLVEQQGVDDDGFDDIVKGKGKGLVFLLHGPAGVGKTLTAEGIADHTKRPLFAISSGQLVGPASQVETTLSNLLALAKRWGSVVLIDEADVFLQERTIQELERNSLVSILLRILEYFEGTIFLTTNRAETIDSAFRSRIHLSLSYPPLSKSALQILWKNNIVRASAGQHPDWLTDSFLDQISDAQVNGRDVKNIVRMAYAVSKNGKRKMVPEDVQQGLKALKSFEVDMIHGSI
ncbi:P-loop containing nucleoside triphosphate hydrolase protein [Dactylonectria macrodidyma]|uniref:P-loop containing nucleoside triphosphate hydrolase protein n=1 Tax=Dactylonectria macrodidyma TaxID=307937 RepID=A0A9P9FPG0_9HYPO|nr:P-loop containing nucleoside triphosphate hydrolase protein [Dactylonectria macrodidyma]